MRFRQHSISLVWCTWDEGLGESASCISEKHGLLRLQNTNKCLALHIQNSCLGEISMHLRTQSN